MIEDWLYGSARLDLCEQSLLINFEYFNAIDLDNFVKAR